MNKLILQFLNDYIQNTDPQYAVMLKGKWGCGKTYFIKQWLKTFEHKNSDDQFSSLNSDIQRLLRILISITKTTKDKIENQKKK